MDEIRNKVAESGIITLDLASMKPKGERVLLDIAPQLWQGIALKEKDFRAWVSTLDVGSFEGKHVAVHCSTDAIIPAWAYMLIASELGSVPASTFYGDLKAMEELLYKSEIDAMDLEPYRDKRIMLKGCGDKVPTGSYLYLSQRLCTVVKSLMFGEPCSAVPVYKAKRA